MVSSENAQYPPERKRGASSPIADLDVKTTCFDKGGVKSGADCNNPRSKILPHLFPSVDRTLLRSLAHNTMPQIHNDDARPTEQGEEASDDAANLLSEEADQPQNLADQPPAASGAPRTISSELDGEPDCSRKNAMRSSTILIHPLTTAAEIPGQDALDAVSLLTSCRIYGFA